MCLPVQKQSHKGVVRAEVHATLLILGQNFRERSLHALHLDAKKHRRYLQMGYMSNRPMCNQRDRYRTVESTQGPVDMVSNCWSRSKESIYQAAAVEVRGDAHCGRRQGLSCES